MQNLLPSSEQHPQLNVAVGLIVRNGQVLIAWRDSSQHQGGRYEFSGSKVDAEESVLVALARELAEELSIQVTKSRFVRRLTYRYPEKTVCLHVYRIDQFSGEPHGAEGQPIKWVAPSDLWNYQFPDANRPILRAAQLPDLYRISHDVSAFTDLAAWLTYHVQAVAANAWLYVRVPTLDVDAQAVLIQQLQQQRPDVKLVAQAALYDLNLSVAGYHLRQADLLSFSSVPRLDERQLWFAAVHDAQSIQAADALGVDAMGLGAVLPTASHPEQAGIGWDLFQKLAGLANCPVYALGGQSPATLNLAQQYAGYGVAGIRGLLLS